MNENNLVLASLGKRLGGALIDSIIAMAIILPIMFVTGVFQQLMSGQQLAFSQQITFFVLGVLVLVVLHGYLLYTKGQTIGKMVVNTKIVDMNGELPHVGRSIGLRYLLLYVFTLVPIVGNFISFIDVLFIFRKDRRCLHDLVAGTQVVDA